jgi:hypothetical protein
VTAGAYRLNASVPVTVSSSAPSGGGVVRWGTTATATTGGGLVSYSSSGSAEMVAVTVSDADVTGVTVVVRQR